MKRLLPPLLLTMLLLICAVGQTKNELTVERIFELPSLEGVRVSNIQWSPDGKLVSYLRSSPDEELKSLWLFDINSGKSSKVLEAGDLVQADQRFSREEEMVRERTRQTDIGITGYFWSPDGKAVFVPLNGDVYAYELASRKTRRVTSTPETEFDPKISPDGKRLAYVREGELFVLDIATGKEIQLSSGATAKVKNGMSEFIAQEEMDRSTGYWWSPDGQNIAYLQIDNTPVREFTLPDFTDAYSQAELQEYPRAGEPNAIVKVGVVGVSGGATRWLISTAQDDSYLPRINWLTDGKTLAVQVQTRNQDTLDLKLFDITTGSSRLLLRETDSRWVSLHEHLMFLPGRRQFVWSSERDGFRHFYLYDMNGKLIRQITKGHWEVDKLAGVDAKSGVVYFTATQKSPVERHFYSINLDGSGLRRISMQDGWHEVTVAPNYKNYVDEYSTLVRPPMLTVRSFSGATTAMMEENEPVEIGKYALPVPEFFTFTTSEGITLHAFIIKPLSFTPATKYPCIQYVYGGPTSQIVQNKWGAGGGMARATWHRLMAERGYIVFGVDGRGTPGRGREFQNLIHNRLGAVELEDQMHGVSYLKTLPFVDSSRIMIWGKSYGGFMTCMAMFTTAGMFKVGISLAPVTSWNNYDTHYTERYLELPQSNPEGYRLSSPVNAASGLTGRFLLVHGMADDNVHFQESVLLAEALQKANKQFDFMPYPRSTHSFAGRSVGTHLYNLLARYIRENL
jgi:dipeptidyl-peptidase-4